MSAEPTREQLFGGRTVTVESMFIDPAWIRQRVQRLAEQAEQMGWAFGPVPPLTRRQRMVGKVRGWREWLACRIAPWLERP